MGKRTLTGNVFILLLQQFLLAVVSALSSEALHQNGGECVIIFFEIIFFNLRWGLRITPGLTLLSALLVLFFLYDPPRSSLPFLIFFATLQGRPRLPENLFSMQKRGESEGKEEAALERTSWLQDLKYIFSVKSFVLNAVGKVDTLIQVPKNHLLQVLPVSPSLLGPWLTSPQSTLRLESTLLQKAALAMTQNLSPLTRTLSTLS